LSVLFVGAVVFFKCFITESGESGMHLIEPQSRFVHCIDDATLVDVGLTMSVKSVHWPRSATKDRRRRVGRFIEQPGLPQENSRIYFI